MEKLDTSYSRAFDVFERWFDRQARSFGMRLERRSSRTYSLEETLCKRSKGQEVLTGRGVSVRWNVRVGKYQADLVCERAHRRVVVVSAEEHGGFVASVKLLRRLLKEMRSTDWLHMCEGVVFEPDPLAELVKPKGLYFARGNRIAMELATYFNEEE